MNDWRKYSLKHRARLYDDSSKDTDIAEAIFCAELDDVREDQKRIEALIKHPEPTVRGQVLISMLGGWHETKWLPTAYANMEEPEMFNDALHAIMRHVTYGKDDRLELFVRCTSQVRKRLDKDQGDLDAILAAREVALTWRRFRHKGYKDIIIDENEPFEDVLAVLDEIDKASA